jgi:hypothetical protein
MCFVWISEQTAIISLYSINSLVLRKELVILNIYCNKMCTRGFSEDKTLFDSSGSDQQQKCEQLATENITKLKMMTIV